MRISGERSMTFLVELGRDRIPFSVRYDGAAIIVSDIGEDKDGRRGKRSSGEVLPGRVERSVPD